jgi:hypothetical protein
MKKLKHSKFKNTGILFEMLVRQIAADTLNNTKSKSIDLIKKYFNKNTELSKELELYQTLMTEKFNKDTKATQLLEAVVQTRKQINSQALSRQKYNLIKDIQKAYPIQEFFKCNVNNYKELASIYKLFEYELADNPADMVRTRHAIVEQICTKNASKPEVAELKEFTQQDKDIRLLSYKLLVDKFNTKYSTLNGAQKGLLREYINNVNNTVALKSYIDLEVPKLQSALKIFIPKIGDKVTKIKLTETVSLLDKIKTSKSIKDNHILSMLRYYELVKELKKI